MKTIYVVIQGILVAILADVLQLGGPSSGRWWNFVLCLNGILALKRWDLRGEVSGG